jgi:hypothetical protein
MHDVGRGASAPVGRRERIRSREAPRLPALLCLSLCLCAGRAPAEAGQNDVVREKAAETFRQGVEAFDRRDFETARVAFLQTLALKPREPVVQRNLGLSEIYSGHYLDGARRLARVLQTTGDGSSEERSRMLDSLKKAEQHLQRLTIEVDVEGASISVAGEDLGRSPLPFAWYVEPGPYDVKVSKDGYRASAQSGLAKAGSAEHLRIVLTQEIVAPPPAAPSAEPRLAAESEQSPATFARAPSPWVIASGVAVAVGGVATGVTFSLLASSSSEKGDDRGKAFALQYPGDQDCDTPTTDAGRNDACAGIKRAYKQHDSRLDVAFIGYAVGGAAALATVVYALWLAPEEKVGAASPGRRHTALVPALPVSPGDPAGVLLSGEF